MGARHALTGAMAIGALHALTPAMAAKAPQVFAPSTPWNVDYADESCVLRRNFGTPDRKVVLELRQFVPGDVFYATIAAKFISAGQGKLKVRFVPDTAVHEAQSAYSLVYSQGMEGVVWTDSFRPDQATVEEGPQPRWIEIERNARESSIRGVEVSGRASPAVSLATGEMHRPMTAMRGCMDELLTDWGIDAAAQRTLSRPAWPVGQANWARVIQANYPSAMLMKMKGGIVRLRMIVSPDGKATSCHILVPSQDPSFEKTACAGMMKAARFDPALDASGKPIASYYAATVVYMVN